MSILHLLARRTARVWRGARSPAVQQLPQAIHLLAALLSHLRELLDDTLQLTGTARGSTAAASARPARAAAGRAVVDAASNARHLLQQLVHAGQLLHTPLEAVHVGLQACVLELELQGARLLRYQLRLHVRQALADLGQLLPERRLGDESVLGPPKRVCRGTEAVLRTQPVDGLSLRLPRCG